MVLENDDLLALFLPVLRADMEIIETYQDPGNEPFGFPVSAFGGHEDPEVGAEDLDAWRSETRSDFRLHMFPGDHFFIQSARPALLRVLGEELVI